MGKRERKALWNDRYPSCVEEISTSWNIFPKERHKPDHYGLLQLGWSTSGRKYPREQVRIVHVRCDSLWQSPSSITSLKSVEGTCTQALMVGFSPAFTTERSITFTRLWFMLKPGNEQVKCNQREESHSKKVSVNSNDINEAMYTCLVSIFGEKRKAFSIPSG